MDARRFEALRDELFRVQSRKQVGLLSADDLQQFVELVERIENYFSGIQVDLRLRRIRLLPKTTERNYERHTEWSGFPQKYTGPRTQILYSNKEYLITRVEGGLRHFHLIEGAVVSFEVTGQVYLAEIYNIFYEIAKVDSIFFNKGSDDSCDVHVILSVS